MMVTGKEVLVVETSELFLEVVEGLPRASGVQIFYEYHLSGLLVETVELQSLEDQGESDGWDVEQVTHFFLQVLVALQIQEYLLAAEEVAIQEKVHQLDLEQMTENQSLEKLMEVLKS
jgi:hypothetical protein